MITVKSVKVVPKKSPAFQYDCDHCKYSWTCGYTCACLYVGRNLGELLPDPPINVRAAVNFARHGRGMMPKYIGQEDLKHLLPEAAAKLMKQQLEKQT